MTISGVVITGLLDAAGERPADTLFRVVYRGECTSGAGHVYRDFELYVEATRIYAKDLAGVEVRSSDVWPPRGSLAWALPGGSAEGNSMKAREIEIELRRVGAVMTHKDGDHHVWKLPNGRRFDVPFGGGQGETKPYLLSKLRRILREPAGGR